MGPKRAERRTMHVTIVSNNVETRDGLEEYLRAAGVTARGTSDITQAPELTPAKGASLVLFFPDDFAPRAAEDALAALRQRRPATQSVLVTREPKRFAHLATGAPSAPLVVPKPVWGWIILDMIRARAGAAPDGEVIG